MNLGVNIDHIATLRQARRGVRPDPVAAARIAEQNGAWGITAHLREDRRHIQDSDIERLAVMCRLNMEMAATDEMVEIACRIKPHSCCLVPEKRAELTTEGGLDICSGEKSVKKAVKCLQTAGITVSFFIDAERKQLEAAARIGAEYIELHTGKYANLTELSLDEDETSPLILSLDAETELQRLIAGAQFAHSLGLRVNAGHGIDYRNLEGILRIPHLHELNIGYSIISRALFTGLPEAVRTMAEALKRYS